MTTSAAGAGRAVPGPFALRLEMTVAAATEGRDFTQSARTSGSPPLASTRTWPAAFDPAEADDDARAASWTYLTGRVRWAWGVRGALQLAPRAGTCSGGAGGDP
ncbi:hypothetical protein QJS66_09455 [Kocuria rhizophila]|nr:hypothetical protein QJS66_09455 [Kocuria rhizophila]